jgi:hypothetical protein
LSIQGIILKKSQLIASNEALGLSKTTFIGKLMQLPAACLF